MSSSNNDQPERHMNGTQRKYPDLVEKALENPKVRALFETLTAQTSITFMEVEQGDWTCQTVDGRTHIDVSPTKYPAEALAHELLHTEIKLAGYRQYTLLGALVPPERLKLYSQVLSMLDNELQHHRMFHRFGQLGLAGKRFYNDDDKSTFGEVRKQVETMCATDPAAEFLLQFVSVIALGGSSDERQRKPLRNFIRSRCSADTWLVLLEIERHIAAWRQAPVSDAKDVIRSILALLVGVDRVWFAEKGVCDLSMGHFVDVPFSEEEAQSYQASCPQ